MAIIFTVLFCLLGSLIIIFGIKMFVTLICILIAVVGYIAIMKFRLFGTSLTGANLHKREPIDLVNLNINVIEDGRGGNAKEFDKD